MSTDAAEWLCSRLDSVGAFSGTVHIVDNHQLILMASRNIPEIVRALIERIPRGKGIAGQAWQQEKPMQVCNLQTDPNPVIRPGARDIPAEGALAVPVFDEHGQVRAIVGFGFSAQEALTDRVVKEIELLAKTLPVLEKN